MKLIASWLAIVLVVILVGMNIVIVASGGRVTLTLLESLLLLVVGAGTWDAIKYLCTYYRSK